MSAARDDVIAIISAVIEDAGGSRSSANQGGPIDPATHTAFVAAAVYDALAVRGLLSGADPEPGASFMTDDDIAGFRKVILGNLFRDTVLTDAEIRAMFANDRLLVGLAWDWGWWDTEVREKAAGLVERFLAGPHQRTSAQWCEN